MCTSSITLQIDERHTNSVYVEAKQEYTLQLLSLMEKYLYNLLETEYQNAKNNTNEDEVLEQYQQRLVNIRDWNQSKIDTIYEDFIRNSNCDWFESLLGAIIVANIRVLSTIRTRQTNETLQVEVPKGNYFFHRALIEISRDLYRRPYLFYQIENDDDLVDDKVAEILKMIHTGIEKAIRASLPVQQLMNTYLSFSNQQVMPQQKTTEEENILDTLSPLPMSDDEETTDNEDTSDSEYDSSVDESSQEENPLPEDPLPENPLPENPLPEEPVPEQNVPEEPVPEQNVPEERVPEENVPEENVPEEHVPEVHVREENVREEQPVMESLNRATKEIQLEDIPLKNAKYRLMSRRMTDHQKSSSMEHFSPKLEGTSEGFFGRDTTDSDTSFFERG